MDEIEPQSRPRHPIDKYGPKFVDKVEKGHDLAVNRKVAADGSSAQDKSAGGFDSTPIPYAPPGYTLKFTFHRAVNLPFADFSTFSSDPYVAAQLNVDLPQRHKQDPNMTFRTPTVRRDTNPVWNSEWIVANVPASGFELRCHLYDEDPADHDDKLGVAFVEVDSVRPDWPGVKEQSYKVRKRLGSKRVYFFRSIATLACPHHEREAYLVVSIECLGRTPGDDGGHIYTVGPNYWFKHFSPLFGIIAGTKDEIHSQEGNITRYKCVPFLEQTIQCCHSRLRFVLAFKLSRYSSRAQSLLDFIIDMSSSDPLWRASSRRTPSRGVFSIVLYIINMSVSITSIGPPFMANSHLHVSNSARNF